MSSFWKLFPPGWFAFEWDYEGELHDGGDDEEERDEDEDDGDGGGWEDSPIVGDEGDGDESDGDGGRDWWDAGSDDDFDSGRRRDSGDDRDRDSDDFFERERDRQEQERRAREEADRQRRIAEQQRQIEENRRRMEEEQRRQLEGQDGQASVNPETGQVEGPGYLEESRAVNEPLREQFQEYVGANQLPYDPNDPGAMERWVQGQQAPREPGRDYTPAAATRGPLQSVPTPLFRDRDRDYTPSQATGQRIAEGGKPYQVPAIMAAEARPSPTPEREPPPAPPASRVPEIAATAAAQAAAATGASPAQIAETAEAAARIASDKQTLANQSAWTRAAFRSTYGDRAEQEWVRQHETELQRNLYLYGSREPVPGTAASIEGLPAAPDRRIGAVPPPGPMETARYGVTTPAQPRTNANAPTTARITPPGSDAPAAVGPGVAPAPATPPAQAASPAPGVPLQPRSLTSTNPNDMVLIEDSTSGNQRWVMGRELPSWQTPVSPTIPSPWRIKEVRPAITGLTPADQAEADAANPSIRGAPVAAPSSLQPRVPQPTTPPQMSHNPVPEQIRPTPPGQMSHSPVPEQIRTTPGQMSHNPEPERITPSPGYGPDADATSSYPATPGDGGDTGYDPRYNIPGSRQELPAGWGIPTPEERQEPPDLRHLLPPEARQTQSTTTADGIELLPGRYQPIRNIVDYDPVTGQTRERGYGRENLASTDTTVTTGYPGRSLDPVRDAIDTTRPLDTLANLVASTRSQDYDSSQDASNIAHGISALLRGDLSPDGKPTGAWAEPYLNDVARLAWAREERTNGRGNADPRDAPISYIENWKDAFYGSDHTVPLVKELDQQMIDFAAARTPPGKPFNWKDAFGPTGSNGLIQAQVTAVDCGPTAFGAVLRSRGYNADAYAVFDYAIDNGFHSARKLGSGRYTDAPFNGPGAMVQMARQAGLDAQQVALNDAGWAAVDKELAEGRPVMLSSAAHWYAISAKDERGRYYAGPTGLGMSPDGWLPRGAFKYGGVLPDTAVLTRGDVDPNSKVVQRLGLKPPASAPRDTRPLLSGQTQYQAATGPATQQMSQQSPLPSEAAAGPSPRANLKPRFTADETEEMRSRILNEMPDIRFDPNDGVETRMAKMVPALEWLEKEYGVSAEAIAGMAYNENHVGMANSGAVRGNNIWSVQYLPTDKQSTGPIPEGRWAAYPSIKHALARFVGMYAHPENGYRHTWQNRSNADAFLKGLEQDKYVVDESHLDPTFTIGHWYTGVNKGRDLYRRVKAGTVTEREDPSIGRGQ